MKEVTLNGHKVSLYNSIDELPMVRFHRYNKCLLIDAGIGSDISDFDTHIERAVRYFRKDDKENGAKELENLRQSVYMIITEQSVRDLSFACLVYAIDGKKCEDFSDEGLNKILHTLGGASRREISEALTSAKKKIDNELTTYFPELFDDIATKEYYGTLKQRIMAVLENIINGETDERRALINKLDEQIILYVKPKVFTGTKSVEVEHDKGYESLCLTIQKETNADTKRMTVMEFYNAYEYVVKMAKERNKAATKR